MTDSAEYRRTSVGPLFAAVAAALVYVNSLDNPFVYDDYRTVLDNGSIRNLLDPRAIALHEVTRPIVNLSYAVDFELWGLKPIGFHLTNVLLHLLNVVMFFFLTRRMADDRTGGDGQASAASPGTTAFVSAALFAVHPLMTEAVGYISARADVLYAALFFSSLLCGRRWIRDGGVQWWLLTIGFFMVSLLTKESAIMLPAVLFCYERLILDASDRRRSSTILHAALFGLAAVAGIVRLLVFAYVERDGFAPIAWREVLDQAGVIWRYAGLLLVPVGQTVFHDVQPVTSWLEPRALIGGVALVGLIAAMGFAWRWKRIDPMARFGILWFVLLLLPSALLALIAEAEPMAEHRAYLANCGLFFAAGAGAGWLQARLSLVGGFARAAASAALVAVLLSLGARTMLRNAMWADPVALWREAAEKSPKNFLPHTVLGESLHAVGRHEEAVAALRTALALKPDEEMGYMKLAVCLSELHRPGEAAAVLETLERRAPLSPIVSTGRGAIAMLSGDADRARRHFRATIDQDPGNVMALQWLALLEERNAKPAEALRYCHELERLIPGRSSTHDCISRNLAQTVR